MQTMVWILLVLALMAVSFGIGRLFQAREDGKEVRYWKDAFKGQLDGRSYDLTKQQAAYDGLVLWVENRITREVEREKGTIGIANALIRGEKMGYYSVLLHLKGSL